MLKKLLLIVALQFILVGCKVLSPIKHDGNYPSVEETKNKIKNANIKKVVLVVLENTNPEDVFKETTFIKNLAVKDPALAKDPTEKGFAKNSAYLSNYHAVAHPSQPNYIALISGSIKKDDGFYIWDDSEVNPKIRNRRHLGNQLDDAKLKWMTYAEGYPFSCDNTHDPDLYKIKHAPFLSFGGEDEQANTRYYREHITGVCNLPTKAADFPDFSLVIPNLCSDAHGASKCEGDRAKLLPIADEWLRKRFEGLINDTEFKNDVLFIVTFDENDKSLFGYPFDNDNKVFTVLYGNSVKPAEKCADHVTEDCKYSCGYSEAYNHYDLLRTIEEIFGLDSLNPSSLPIGGVWK